MVTGQSKDNRENDMLKDFSIENWILGGTAFIVIFTIGCFVWFQFQMSTIETYDNPQKVETQHNEETSDIDHDEIRYIEINETEDNDTTGKNSTDSQDFDDEFSDATATQEKFSQRSDASADSHRQHLTRNTELKLFDLNV